MRKKIFILTVLVITVLNSYAQYCTSNGNTSYQTSTTRVVFNTIDNSSGKTAYSDYTSISTTVNAGSTYNLTVQVNTDGSSYTVHSMVWIDWNGDNDFSDPGEEYDLGTATGVSNGATSASPYSVTVPLTAAAGNTRMRVSTKYNSAATACETGYDGEVEDYTINVLSNGAVTFYNTVASNGYTYFDNIRTDATPRFTISSTGDFNTINFEINTKADFTGTSYTQTISTTTHSANTHYDFLCDNISPALPTTNGAVYYVRARTSNDGGTTWGSWSNQTWSFTHDVSNYGWFQTAQAQFEEGSPTGGFIQNTTNGTTADYIYMTRGSSTNLLTTASDQALTEGSSFYSGASNNCITVGYYNVTSDYDYHGFRFQSVNIPQGATILSATFQPYAHSGSGCGGSSNTTNALNLLIKGADVDNCAAWADNTSSTTGAPRYRTRTTAQENWYVPQGSSQQWSTGQHITTAPDISSVIQEIVNRPGFVEGNDIGLLVDHTGSTGDYWRYFATMTASSSYRADLSTTFTDFENYWLSPVIEFPSMACSPNYQQLIWDADQTYGSVKIQLYYDNGGTPTIIPDAALPGNSTGLTTSPVDLSSLNTSTYSKLYIRAILRYTSTATNQTPKLNSWAITADPVASADAGSNQDICPSSSATLNFTGCGMIQWSTGDTASSITVSPASTTTYTVTATTGDGDVASASVQVNVLQSVSASATPTTICEGTTVTINSSNVSNVTWSASPADASLSGQENNTSINVTPTSSTTYTVTDNVCSTTDNVTITVNARPSATASSNSSVCYGDDINLTSSPNGMQTYAWDGPNSYSSISQNPTIVSATNTDAGTYTVIVTDGNGCKDTATTTVSVTTLPLSFTANTPLCEGATLNLNENSPPPTYMVAYNWSGPNSFSQNGQNATISNVDTSMTGYYVITKTGNGCVRKDSIMVTVNPAPNVDSILVTDVTVCVSPYNGEIHVYDTGTYTYSFDGSAYSSTNYVDTFNVGSHTVSVENSYGCRFDTTVNVNSNTSLSIDSIVVTDAKCYGDSGQIIIYDVDAVMYSVDNGANFQTDSSYILPSGVYNIIIEDAGGCQAIQTDSITQPTQIVLDTTVVNTTCGQGGQASVIATGGTGTYSYSWSNGDTLANINNLSPDTFYVTVTDQNMCTQTTSAIVGNNGGYINIESVDVTSLNCYGDANASIIINMSSGGIPPYNFTWSNDTSNHDSTAVNLSAGTYYVTVADTFGCSDDTVITIQEPTQLTVQTSISDVKCYGENTGIIITNVSGGTPPYNYNWSNNQTDSIANNLQAGSYLLTVTDSKGCTVSVDKLDVNQPDSLEISLDSLKNLNCFNDNSGYISVAVTGGTQPYSYSWSNNQNDTILTEINAGTYTLTITDNNYCQTIFVAQVTEPQQITISDTVDNNIGYASVIAQNGMAPYSYEWSNNYTGGNSQTGLSSGTYTVTISDNNGCTVVDTFEILTPLQIPLAITPNADGYNDTWQIKGIGSYEHINIEVYNRWGNLVYTFDGSGAEYQSNPWNGDYNGKKLPIASYVFVLNLYDNNQPITGAVLIKE